MKFIILLFTAIAFGQHIDPVLYGTVTCSNPNVTPESGSVWISYETPETTWFTTESPAKDGTYYRTLKDASGIEVETSYHDYYAEKVTVAVNSRDSIRIDLHLIPKPYIYTGKQAIADTRIKKIRLITFDSLEYEWTKKINLQKDFGFSYVYMPRPRDYDFVTNIQDYNNIVEGYLTLKDNSWGSKLSGVRDSIIHLEPDNYGRNHKIDIKSLKIPEREALPGEMQDRISRLQQNYDSWYKEELKDYTVAYTLNVIKTDKEYDHFYLLPERISMDYKTFLPELINLLLDDTEVGMDDYPGIMWCRNIAPTGPVGCVALPFTTDDLFTVAGRANYILKRLTKEDFGNVLPNPDKKWLKKLQNRWAYWLLQLQEK